MGAAGNCGVRLHFTSAAGGRSGDSDGTETMSEIRAAAVPVAARREVTSPGARRGGAKPRHVALYPAQPGAGPVADIAAERVDEGAARRLAAALIGRAS